MKFSSLDDLLLDQLKDLYSVESQLIKALPRMARGSTSEALREAFADHLEQTRGQLERLQRIGEMLDMRLTGKKCNAMEGLIEEGKEILESEGEAALIDAALIAAAQRVEHYEIAVYGTARTLARELGHEEAAHLLQQGPATRGKAKGKTRSGEK
jgi:ferritin-like metal-binding protein YciE